jgi:ferredoxin
MDAAFAAARARGWPEAAMAREYFAAPEAPPRVNHPFTLVLGDGGREIAVPPERSAVAALAEAGVVVQTKCSDGICGVCAARHDGTVAIEHRDYVLSAAERERRVILCCSRPREPGARLVIDLRTE